MYLKKVEFIRTAALVLTVVPGLAACSEPARVSESPPGISYRVTDGGVDATRDKAAQYCGKYGKHAVLDHVDKGGAEPLAVYGCR